MARDGRLVAGAPVGVRINAVDTAFHQDDLRAVAELAAHVAVDAVWLPKVERPDDLRAVLAALPAGLRVVVMAETRAGVAALPAVLAQGAGRLSGAVFGHVDYSLDTGLWPFPGADSAEVWDAAVRVMRAAEASDCPYIHTIVTELEDDEVFLRTQSMLAHLCRRPFARITLSLRQSRAAGRPFEPRPMALRSSPAQTLEERRAQALHVIEEFEQTRCRKRSFSLERSSRRLLSPHEYLLARRIVALHSPRP